MNIEEKTASVTNNTYSGFLTIPESIIYDNENYIVNAIEDYAFYWSDLLSVTIPNSVRNIGIDAFYGCSLLASVKIGEGVESIDGGAFRSCSNLQSVSIGKNVRHIGANAFYGNNSLSQVYITDLSAWCQIDFADLGSNPLYESHHLYLNMKEIKELVIPEDITTIKDYVFAGGSNIGSLTIGNNISSIGAYSFYQCSSLTSVELASSINSIKDRAFYECTELETIQLPDDIESIGQYCFYSCTKLEKLKLPENLKHIKYSAFEECNSLTNIIIPNKVEIIDSYAFYNTNEEQLSIIMKPEYPPLAISQSFPNNPRLYVPDESIEPYQNVAPWSNFDMHTFSSSGPEKCATPVVSYTNGVLSFSSDTPEVDFHYVITSADGQKSVGNILNISGNCIVSVYASKNGYEDSVTVTEEINIIGKMGDVNRDGEVNVADHVKLTEIIMGQTNDSNND